MDNKLLHPGLAGLAILAAACAPLRQSLGLLNQVNQAADQVATSADKIGNAAGSIKRAASAIEAPAGNSSPEALPRQPETPAAALQDMKAAEQEPSEVASPTISRPTVKVLIGQRKLWALDWVLPSGEAWRQTFGPKDSERWTHGSLQHGSFVATSTVSRPTQALKPFFAPGAEAWVIVSLPDQPATFCAGTPAEVLKLTRPTPGGLSPDQRGNALATLAERPGFSADKPCVAMHAAKDLIADSL